MSALSLYADDPVEPSPLWPHQLDAMDMLRRSIRAGHRRIVMQLPTGAGKTRVAAEIVHGALEKGNTVSFLVPKISLVDQTVERFSERGIQDIGVIQANHPLENYQMPCQIISIQTLARRAVPQATMVIVDEAHEQYLAVRKWMEASPNMIFVGLSATPWSAGMGDLWDDLLIPVRMQELIDKKFLSPFRVFSPSHPDLRAVKTIAGDYHEGQLSEVMSGTKIVADVVQTWKNLAEERTTLVFAVDRAHAAHLQREFGVAGVSMGYCDANTEIFERKALFRQMRSGQIKGIVNVGTLTTGVDEDVRCIVLARPTKSEMLFVQCVGRGLRTAAGKNDCLILDHADNHNRLGFVTDIHHDKLLTGKERIVTKKDRGEPMPKECKGCGNLRPPGVHACPACGFTPTPQNKVGVEDGVLLEMKTKPKVKRPPTMGDKQKFWSMALWVAQERGRSRGWASHLYREKFDVWPRGIEDYLMEPDQVFRGFEHSRRIAFAKSKA